MRIQKLAGLVHGQQTSVVGQRVDEDDGVLTCLHDLVEVADGAVPYGPGERSVDPDGLVALDQVAPHEVAAREVLVARNGDEIAGDGAIAAVPDDGAGHVLEKAGLATSRRSLEQHRQTALPGRREHLHFVADGEVVGRLAHAPSIEAKHGWYNCPGALACVTARPVPRCRHLPARRSPRPRPAGEPVIRHETASGEKRKHLAFVIRFAFSLATAECGCYVDAGRRHDRQRSRECLPSGWT